MDAQSSDTTPQVLDSLIAARLVSHELIADPARTGDETALLAALCARVSGPVYRIGAFHYGFRPEPCDLDGLLATLDAEEWAGAIEASLAAEFGTGAAWVNAADPGAAAEAALDARAVLFLEAGGAAARAGLVDAPELAAVINARLAVLTAETTAGLAAEAIERAAAEAGLQSAALARAVETVAGRIEALEGELRAGVEAAARTEARRAARLEAAVEAAIETAAARLAGTLAETVSGAVSGALSETVSRALAGALSETLPETVPGSAPALDPAVLAGIERLAEALPSVLARLEVQEGLIAEQTARQDGLASGIAALDGALAALAADSRERGAGLADFEGRLGLTLAEFLARIGIDAASAFPAPRAAAVPVRGGGSAGESAGGPVHARQPAVAQLG